MDRSRLSLLTLIAPSSQPSLYICLPPLSETEPQGSSFHLVFWVSSAECRIVYAFEWVNKVLPTPHVFINQGALQFMRPEFLKKKKINVTWVFVVGRLWDGSRPLPPTVHALVQSPALERGPSTITCCEWRERGKAMGWRTVVRLEKTVLSLPGSSHMTVLWRGTSGQEWGQFCLAASRELRPLILEP